jgi:NTE family protein
MMSHPGPKTALVVSGGGARAAYEVGVLKALRELTPDSRKNPFPLLCGVSGGALNATSLAITAEDFGAGIDALESFWSDLHAGDIYRADPLGVLASGGRWLAALAFGWLFGSGPRALFDSRPLDDLLTKRLDFVRLEHAIASHAVHALSITCSGYTSGQCVSFFQGRADLEPWQRAQWGGAHVSLGVQHIMASMAVPFLFPAVKLHREYFGDGVMRELVPLSPAIRLGADRILVIGTGRMAVPEGERHQGDHYPKLAETAGHVLSGIYIDSLSADIERMSMVNRLVSLIPEETRRREAIPWRPIDLMVIEPSERLDFLAFEHVGKLPWATRSLLRGIGAAEHGGGAFASYLLFESAYTRALIDLGYRDAMARAKEIIAFLRLDLDAA